MSNTVLSVLIPAYNESAFIEICIHKIMAVELPGGIERELVIVDDASKDDTVAIAQRLKETYPCIRIFEQSVNQGKGAAIARAIQEMTGDIALFQDADLEYDPNDYIAILTPFLEGHADVVYGSRFAATPQRRVLNYHHRLINKTLTHLSNWCTGLDITDMETCYKAFKADLLRSIPLRSNRFGLEPEITAKVAKRNCTVYEVPIAYHGRSAAEGKKIGIKDGFNALFTILKYALIDDCWDEDRHGTRRQLHRALKFNKYLAKRLERRVGHRAIQLNANQGKLTHFLPKKVLFVAADADEAKVASLASAYRYNERIEAVQWNPATDEVPTALRDKAFDTVIALHTLEYVDDLKGTLERVNRLLAPGGELLLAVPHGDTLHPTLDGEDGIQHRMSIDGWRSILVGSGFSDVTLKPYHVLAWLCARWAQASGRSSFKRWEVKLIDMLTPPWLLLERVLPMPGHWLVGWARKS